MRERIPMQGGYELVVGEPGRRPDRAARRRLQKRVRRFMEENDPSEWDAIGEGEDLSQWELAWLRVVLWEEVLESVPEMPALLHLADSWVAAGEIDEALRVAREALAEEERVSETEELIVKLLVHQGRPLRDFPWRGEVPKVARLDETTRRRCVAYVRDRGVVDVLEMTFDLFPEEVTLFDCDQLEAFLVCCGELGADDGILFPAEDAIETASVRGRDGSP